MKYVSILSRCITLPWALRLFLKWVIVTLLEKDFELENELGCGNRSLYTAGDG